MFAVTNAGMHPELAQAAAGLAERGEDVHYWTSLAWTRNRAVRLVPRSWTSFASMISLRTLPDPLTSTEVNLAGSGYEILFELATSRSEPLASAALRRRNRVFQEVLIDHYRRRSRRFPDTLVSQSTNAELLFRKAPYSTRRVLNYPLPHPLWVSDYLGAERRLNPQWADYLQHDQYDDHHQTALKEIAAADFVLLASSFSHRTFVEAGVPPQKLLLVPLGAYEATPPMPRPAPSLNEGPLRLLFVGQVNHRKGIGYLSEAFQRVGPDLNISLTIAGPIAADLERSLSAIPGVKVIGPTRRDRLLELYGTHDVMILPTLADGFGLVCAEALSLGTPVITTENSMGPDFIENGVNGILLKPGDTGEIEGAIIYCSENLAQVRREWPSAAVRSARMLSWDVYRERFWKAVFCKS